MKKTLLFSLLMGTGLMMSAQQTQVLSQHNALQAKHVKAYDEVVFKHTPAAVSAKPVRPEFTPKRDVTIIEIGHSANSYSYGYGGGQKTILWAEPTLNAVCNTHRMTADVYSGNLAMDLSKDGGTTWDSDVQVYESNISGGQYNIDAIRYPHGAIYNPAGNTSFENAYLAFFGANLDGSGGDTWGGYSFGTANLDDYTDTTKNMRAFDSSTDQWQYIPDGFHVCNNGNAWVSDINQDWSTGSLVYKGSLLLNKGVWNDTEKDFEYTPIVVPFPVSEGVSRPNMTKVAFTPDGQTGYLATLSNNGSIDFSAGCYYPILWKTTDGGETWSEPFSVQLGGPDGIHGILNYLTDEQLAELYEDVPARDEIPYTTAFDFDLAVDASGNPHFAVVVGVKGNDDYSVVAENGYGAPCDIFSRDGGLTWNAYALGNIQHLRGNFPDEDYTEDNRIQISTTLDGTRLFVSWIDTNLEGAEDNSSPDIYCAGINPGGGKYTPAYNVTEYTEGWWQAYFFAASYYVFDKGSEYEIPFTYEDMENAQDPGAPVSYKYVKDFVIPESDFTIIGVQEVPQQSILNVHQNYPNPFSGSTTIEVSLDETSELFVEVYSLTGQKVLEENKGRVAAGNYQFKLNASDLGTGVYFYTVTAGQNSITKKMVIK